MHLSRGRALPVEFWQNGLRHVESQHADVNAADGVESFTALMFAAAEGNIKVVEVLLAHDADKTRRDNVSYVLVGKIAGVLFLLSEYQAK